MLRLDWNLLFTVINLLVLYVLMHIFLFKPVKKIIDQRQAAADEQFGIAADKQKEADDLKAEYEANMADIEQKRVATMKEARKNADAEYHRIVHTAETESRQMREDARVECENQKAQVLRKAEKEIADMVVDATEKLVSGHKGAETDRALYEEFLNKAGDNSDAGSN